VEISTDGEPPGPVSNISPLQEAERRLGLISKVFRDAADPIVLEDLSGRIIDLNESAERVFGYRREELLGQQSSLLVPVEAQKQMQVLRRRCRRSEHVRDVETVRQRKSRRVFPVSLTMSPLSDENSTLLAVASITKDISRRKRAEIERERYAAELETTNQQLRESIEKRAVAEAVAVEESRRREQFLAMLSHELRTPVAALLHATQLLESQDTDDSVKPAVHVISRQSRHIARLLDDLLDVSRAIQGKIEIRRERVDLLALTQDAIAAVRPLVDTRHHVLAVDVPEAPLHVEGDPARLRQVVENLLVNAAKYTPQGGHITLCLHRDSDAAEMIVRDDGIGIAAEMLDRVFDLFIQSNATRDGSGGGMGVGLTLVRHLVQLQGGTVTARSDGPQRGSTFVVRLPLAAAPPVNPQPQPEMTPTAARKIVLVEDDRDAREMLKALLELDGHTVVAAADGKRGVEIILTEEPDIALVDIGLPELDGFGVAQQVRCSPKGGDVLLVALTGYGQEKDRAAVVAAGFDEHLVKPLMPSELDRVMNRPKNAERI
jgi:two-component system CheB/CheR fusion protein